MNVMYGRARKKLIWISIALVAFGMVADSAAFASVGYATLVAMVVFESLWTAKQADLVECLDDEEDEVWDDEIVEDEVDIRRPDAPAYARGWEPWMREAERRKEVTPSI